LRDYYVAQAASGALLWVFCSRWWAAAPVVETEAPDMPQGAADLPVARGKAATRARVRGEPVWFLQGQFG
jgi:hypothetical protein